MAKTQGDAQDILAVLDIIVATDPTYKNHTADFQQQLEGFSGFLTELKANIVVANALPAQGTTEEDYEKHKDILEDAFNKKCGPQ